MFIYYFAQNCISLLSYDMNVSAQNLLTRKTQKTYLSVSLSDGRTIWIETLDRSASLL